MIHYADLLIRVLPRGEGGSCPVEVTYSGEQEFPRGTLDPEILGWKPTGVPEEDGTHLFAALLGEDSSLRRAWAETRGGSEARRVRLYLDAAEPGLHMLPWELMCDGASPLPLAADPKTPFSRHLPTEHPFGRPVFQRPLRLLAAVANPPGLDGFGCDPLDVEKEKENLRTALKGIPAEDLEITFLDGPVTRAALAKALGGGPHILHLVAHGHFDPEVGASLYLEAEEGGKVEPATEADVVGLLPESRESLRLIFLASCESAKRSDGDAFRGLAPKLVAAGIPAVVAMQEEVEIADAGRFATEFYGHLLKEGVVDLAANHGRAALLAEGSPDAGAPVVFLRLREGRLFGRRGEIKGEEESAFWGSLLDAIDERNCVPILGSGLLEGLLPSPGELARELALDFGYPYPDSDNLPRVAQFGGASDSQRPRLNLLRLMASAFRRRYGLAPASKEDKAGLSTVIRDADWPKLSAAMDETEVHHDLADLGLPLYLTTSFDSFMTEALKARGLNPRRAALPWLVGGEKAQEAVDSLDGFNKAEPLVLHLLGNDEDPKSMVVSEDDYLRYLARVSRHPRNFLSPVLMDTLTDQMLLFLGYRLDDLDLRVLLRHLSHLDYPEDRPLNLAVQMDPQQDDGQSQRNAKQYFEDYSSKYRIRIYWGTARQFVAELHDQWERRRHG
jgi:hypothetical protein